MPHKYYNAINIFYKSQYISIQKAWNRHGSWVKAWKNLGKEIKIDPDKEWEKLEKYNITLLLPSDKQFPKIIKEIPSPPFGLYIKGKCEFPSPAVAIVGTRKATQEGQRISQQFGYELAEQNIPVISGLALGVDQAAHKGALEIKGKTIAVLANGLDIIYPHQHENLANKILENNGTVVSEYPIETPPYPVNFLERNRIISGLSVAIIVIEAPYGSGALCTAQFAVEQNREVFVVPGPINQSNYAGSHNLIKSGASLITMVNDIFDALNLPLIKDEKRQNKNINLNKEQETVLNYIENDGGSLSVDKITELTKLQPHVVNQTIAFLVINGIIKEDKGKYYL